MKLDELLAITNEAVLAAGGTKEMAAKVLADIQKAAAEEKADRKESVAKKSKHDFVVLVSDPDPRNTKRIDELPGWVFQIEANGDPSTLPDRVKTAAVEFNNSRKGRKCPVATVGETIQNVPTKFWKTQEGRTTRVKTKQPIYLVSTNNKI